MKVGIFKGEYIIIFSCLPIATVKVFTDVDIPPVPRL